MRSEEDVHGPKIKQGEHPPHQGAKARTALYYWRLLRQLPWLVLRYKL
jgi:hypothetical protein